MKALVWIIIILIVAYLLWMWLGPTDTQAPADTDGTEMMEEEVAGDSTSAEAMMEDGDSMMEVDASVDASMEKGGAMTE